MLRRVTTVGRARFYIVLKAMFALRRADEVGLERTPPKSKFARWMEAPDASIAGAPGEPTCHRGRRRCSVRAHPRTAPARQGSGPEELDARPGVLARRSKEALRRTVC